MSDSTSIEKLSPRMLQCLAFVKAHGMSIYRHPGGFWTRADWKGPHSGEWFRPETVEALVTRHMLFYDRWQDSRAGTFPIRATVTEKPL